MKITQTGDQLVVKTGGVGQLIAGAVFMIIGLALAIALFGGLLPASSGGKKAPAAAGVVGLVFVGIGFLIFKTAQNRTVTIQKAGNVTVDAKRLIGGKSAEQSVPTSSIVAVRLNTARDYSHNNMPNTNGMNGSNVNNQNLRRSTLSLLLNNNDLVELGTAESNGSFSVNGLDVGGLISKAPLSKEANQVSTFLGVPLQADDNSSLAGAVQSVVKAFKHEEDPQPGQPVAFNPNASAAVSTPSSQPPQTSQVAAQPVQPVQPAAPIQQNTMPVAQSPVQLAQPGAQVSPNAPPANPPTNPLQ